MSWNGKPGPQGAVIDEREEIIKKVARLSLTGNLERTISLCRAWSFLIPYYGSYTIKNPEVFLPQILGPNFVNRYGHPWERVLSILLRNLSNKISFIILGISRCL